MNQTELVESRESDVEGLAKVFDDMAAQIRLNKGSAFGGAFVVVPPGPNSPMKSLILAQTEPGLFWGLLKTAVELAMASLEDQARHQRGFR